jgi:hypothetical protein
MTQLHACLICGEHKVVGFPKRLLYRWCKDCVKMWEEMEGLPLIWGKRKRRSEKSERVFKIVRTNDHTATLFCVRFE